MIRYLLLLLVIVLLFSRPLGLDMSLAPGLSVKNAFFYLIMLFVMVRIALVGLPRLSIGSIIIPFGLFALYALFSWLAVSFAFVAPRYSVFEGAIALKAGMIDHLLVFLIFLYGLQEGKDVAWLLKGLFIVVILGNMITVMDAFDMPDLGIIQQRDDGRISGLVGESNQFAALLVLFLPGIYMLHIHSEGLKRVATAAALAVSVVALFLSASRGGLLALFAGGVGGAYLFRSTFSLSSVVRYGIVVGMIAVALIAGLLITPYGELLEKRFVDETVSHDIDAVSSGRTVIWEKALNRMIESPWTFVTGFGWARYDSMGEFRYATHNHYLQILFDLGLIALGLFIFVFWRLVMMARQSAQAAAGEAKAYLMAFVFGAVGIGAAIFFVNLYQPWLFFWAYAALAVRLATEVNRNLPDREERLHGSHVQISVPVGRMANAKRSEMA